MLLELPMSIAGGCPSKVSRPSAQLKTRGEGRMLLAINDGLGTQ